MKLKLTQVPIKGKLAHLKGTLTGSSGEFD